MPGDTEDDQRRVFTAIVLDIYQFGLGEVELLLPQQGIGDVGGQDDEDLAAKNLLRRSTSHRIVFWKTLLSNRRNPVIGDLPRMNSLVFLKHLGIVALQRRYSSQKSLPATCSSSDPFRESDTAVSQQKNITSSYVARQRSNVAVSRCGGESLVLC